MYQILASSNPTWLILVLLIAFFGVIALVVFLLRKRFKLNKTEKPKDEKEVAKENLSHFLEDVDDPETQKQFDEYSEKQEDRKENEEKKDK
jgi:hypothetical protein